jgi:hypothetical protein
MAKFLRISGGVPRSFYEASSTPIYDENITIVESGAGTNELNGPITAGTPITLPNGETYNSTELEITLNKFLLEELLDYNYSGTVPRTQLILTFDLEIGDVLSFRKTRNF